MASALSAAGFTGGLHYGTRASLKADVLRPYATYSVSEIERESNSSGVALVTYEVELSVVVDQKGSVAGRILNVFQRYWSRLGNLTALDSDLARLVLVHPGASEIGEADERDLGEDVILGNTSLQIRISEHQPEIEEV